MTDGSGLSVERIGRIVLLTIRRPQVLNAIDWETHLAFHETWRALAADHAIRAVVLTGEGPKAFCVGADIPKFLPRMAQNLDDGTDTGDFCGMTIEAPLAVPIVAAINGAALGGGLELALASDVRIASRSATLGLPEVRWSVIAGAGGVTRLPRLIPAAVANDMILSGEPISAERALEIGLVSRLSAPESLIEDAVALAERITGNGPEAVRQSTRLLRRGTQEPMSTALIEERRALHSVIRTGDFRLGIEAFRERRTPVYEDDRS